VNGCRSARRGAALLVTLAIAGCGSAPRPAPVIDRMPEGARAGTPRAQVPAAGVREPDPRPGAYTVRRGDTLYAIALDHGLDYRELAAWNGLDNPNRIFVGQTLRLVPPGTGSTVIASPAPGAVDPQVRAVPGPGSADARPGGAVRDGVLVEPRALKLPYSEQALARLKGGAQVLAETRPSSGEPKPATRAPAESAPPVAVAPGASAPDEGGLGWSWPTQGRVVSGFSEARALKGLDIAGSAGQSVVASASGRVVYVGDSLRGYGNLVIIKHNETFLSAYAHNRQVLVKEGQSVSRGQKIAEMGNSDADQVKLHFQIRRYGKPVDPSRYLPLS
jgi:lipoprotein NlpD